MYMRRDDRDDPFEDIFRQIERMMDEMTGGGSTADAGFGGDAHVSTYESEGTVRVVADLPGVDKDDIDIKCDGRSVTVSARTDVSSYEERIDLPVHVDEHSASATFNNGVLEVVFDRADSSASINLS